MKFSLNLKQGNADCGRRDLEAKATPLQIIISRYAREAPGRDTGSGRRYPSPEGPPGPESITCPLTSKSETDWISQILARTMFVKLKHA